jgi:hypothetical protein
VAVLDWVFGSLNVSALAGMTEVDPSQDITKSTPLTLYVTACAERDYSRRFPLPMVGLPGVQQMAFYDHLALGCASTAFVNHDRGLYGSEILIPSGTCEREIGTLPRIDAGIGTFVQNERQSGLCAMKRKPMHVVTGLQLNASVNLTRGPCLVGNQTREPRLRQVENY